MTAAENVDVYHDDQNISHSFLTFLGCLLILMIVGPTLCGRRQFDKEKDA